MVGAGAAVEANWPGLAADIELVGGALSRPARVAIASYEFVGVVRNGGIGTACTELARALADDGNEVDLFFTGWGDDPSEEGFDRHRRDYAADGLRLERLDPGLASGCDAVAYNAAYSLALYRRLKRRHEQQPYDVIHFVESLGHGLYSLLAKRQGLAFDGATMVVGAHSPRRWLAEAHGMPFDHPIELADEFMERRCLELADVLISPSAHMLDWLRENGTNLPRRSYVQQYVTSFDQDPARGAGRPMRVEELVFFGRLEPRKGLMTFCDALDLLADRDHGTLRRVTFLGKESISAASVMGRAEAWPWQCKVISDRDRDAALAYLGGPGRLAVIASTMDNSPNTVYETIGRGIPFLASRGGGTAELVHPEDVERVTYDPWDELEREVDPGEPARLRPIPSGRVLAERISAVLAEGAEPARFAVPPRISREIQVTWHRAAVAEPQAPEPVATELPRTLAVSGLSEMVLPSELVLVVDDEGVTLDPHAVETLAKCAAAVPEVGFFTALGSFPAAAVPGSEREFTPTGGPASTGLLGNCAGAAVTLARGSALRRVGALSPDRPPVSVAELLARAVLAEERVDVVPEVLFRLSEKSVPHGTLAYHQRPLELIRPYRIAFGSPAGDIAALASRLGREEQALAVRLRESEQRAAELSQQLHVLLTSRSMRVTEPLRRVGTAIRRRRNGTRTA